MVEFSLDENHRPISNFLDSFFQEQSYHIFQLAGDASTRRYFRVVVDGESSYVLMVWEPFEDTPQYPFLSVLNEFANHSIAVPKIMAKSPQDGLILMEDLGDLTLERKFWENQDQEVSLPYYRQSLDELLKIHLLIEKEHNPLCTAITTEFDQEKFMWEFRYSMKHFISEFCKVSLSESVETELKGIFEDICQRLLSPQKVICHRDYHSRNVMIKLGKVKVIDFQDARLGPVQYDLVSILKDSYVNLSEDNQNLLLKEYYEKHQSLSNFKYSQAEFFENYEIQTIQRCFKACGSFASFYNTREDRRYLKYLEGTIQTVRKSLMLFPEYSTFLKFLSDHDLFQRQFEAP